MAFEIFVGLSFHLSSSFRKSSRLLCARCASAAVVSTTNCWNLSSRPTASVPSCCWH